MNARPWAHGNGTGIAVEADGSTDAPEDDDAPSTASVQLLRLRALLGTFDPRRRDGGRTVRL